MEPNKELKTGPVNLGIAFIGGCGVNNAGLIINSFPPENHPHVHILAANTDAGHLKLFQENKGCEGWENSERLYMCQLGYELTKGLGAGGDPQIGAKAIEEDREEISHFLDKLQTLLIVAGLGGGTGTGGVPAVAQMAKDKEIPMLTIVTMPFPFEGRMNRANDALNTIRDAVPTIVIYNNNIENRDVLVSEAWEIINKSCLEQLVMVFLRELILEVGDGINSDLKDYTTRLALGHYVQYGSFFFEDKDAPCDPKIIGKELVQNRYQDTEIVKKAESGLILFHGNWSVGEVEKVTGQVKEAINPDRRPNVEFHVSTREQVEDRKKWVAMIVVAKEPPSDQPIEKTGVVGVAKKEKPPEIVRLKPVIKVPFPEDTEDALVSISFPVIVAENGRSSAKMTQLKVPQSLANEWLEMQRGILPRWCGKKPRQEFIDRKEDVRKRVEAYTGKRIADGNDSNQRKVEAADQPHFIGINTNKGGR